MQAWATNELIAKAVVYTTNIQHQLKAAKIAYGILIADANYDKSLSSLKYFSNRINKISVETDMKIGLSDITEMQQFLQQAGRTSVENLFAIFKGDEFYIMKVMPYANKAFQKEAIIEFIQEYKAGTLQPYIKSQPEPEEDYQNGVKVLVGSTIK